jgi:Zn-dependent protease
MSDLLNWSLDLGRWGGARIRVHLFVFVTAVLSLIGSLNEKTPRFLPTVAWLAMYLLVLALHEAGHILAAIWQQTDPDDVMLWPHGNLVMPSHRRIHENLFAISGGLIVNGVLAFTIAIILGVSGARMVLNPFGGDVDSGAPTWMGNGTLVTPLSPIWYLGWFGWLNWIIFFINLLPALPFDMGRILRTSVARSNLGLQSDSMIVPWAAHTVAAFLAIVGVLRLVIYGRTDSLTVIAVAILVEMFVRLESRMMEEGSFYEEGGFGYDFSEGYSSLDARTMKAKPKRESAIKRWRKRRSDQRNQRREAQAAAETRRLDEILEKIHVQGKASLSDDEQRFLLRASTKIRKKNADHD